MQSVRVTGTVADPAPRSMLSLVHDSERNCSFLFGGQVDVAGGSFQPKDDLFVLNVSSHNRWTAVDTLAQKPSARCGHACGILRDNLLVWGGRGQKQLSDVDVHALDLKKREWKTLESSGTPPKARFQHVSWVVGDVMYIFGGHDGRRTCFRDMHSVKINIAENKCEWEEIFSSGDVPQLSGASAHALVQNRLVLIGGSDAQEFSNQVYVFNVEDRQWKQMRPCGNIPAARAALSVVVLHDRIFAFGGSNGQLRFNDFYVIDLDFADGTASWARFPVLGDVPDGRSLHSTVVDRDGNVYLYGGWNGTSCFGDLHVMSMLPAAPQAVPPQFSFESLVDDSALTDCVLLCGGRRFPVHRAVLHARSRVFRLWMETWGSAREVHVIDMQPEVLEVMLRYLYCGRAVIPHVLAVDIAFAADKYGVDGLRAAAARELVCGLSLSNADDAKYVAERFDMPALRTAVSQFISLNAKLRLNTPPTPMPPVLAVPACQPSLTPPTPLAAPPPPSMSTLRTPPAPLLPPSVIRGSSPSAQQVCDSAAEAGAEDGSSKQAGGASRKRSASGGMVSESQRVCVQRGSA